MPPQTQLLFRRNVLAAILALLGVSAVWSMPRLMGAEPLAPTVRLVIDFGDGMEMHFTALAWREGMTALDALSAAKAHRRGIGFSHHGSGANAMVTKIGDVKNEGAGKNWIYYVNAKQAEMSAGACKIKPGETVLWKFEEYNYNQ